MFCRLSVNSKVKGSDRLMFTSLLWTWYDNIVLNSCENFNYRKALGRVVSDVWGPELGASSASDGSCSSVWVCLCREPRVWNQTVFCLELSLQVSLAKLTLWSKTYTSLWGGQLQESCFCICWASELEHTAGTGNTWRNKRSTTVYTFGFVL